ARARTARVASPPPPELHGLAEEPTHHLELRDLGRRVGERAHADGGMEPDRDRAREAPARLLLPLLELEHAPPRVEADPEAIRPLHLEAVKARGGHSRRRVARDEQAGGQV